MILHHSPKKAGFTLIELLVVIVTLGIIASIGIVGWGGLTTSSENRARITELNQWKSTFELYKSRFAVYPSPASDSTYCMGTSPTGNCGVNGTILENAALNSEIARTGKIPTNTVSAVQANGNKYQGPYAVYTPTTITLVAVLKGGSGECKSETTYDSASPSGVAYCRFVLVRPTPLP